MKKSIKLLGIIGLCALAANFQSCKDDNDEPKISPAAEIAGNYEGYSEASCAYFQGQYSDGDKVTITEIDDNHAKIEYTSTEFGSVTVDNAEITGNSTYTITGNGKCLMGMGGNVKEYDCNVSGTVSGKDADLKFVCPAVMGGFTLNFLTGTLPQK